MWHIFLEKANIVIPVLGVFEQIPESIFKFSRENS